MGRASVIVVALCLAACQKASVEPPAYLSQQAGQWHLTRDDLSVTVAPAAGGRISAVTFAGRERLVTQDKTDGNNWGNVLWPSPQSLWGWPPPKALDSEPYQSQVDGTGLTLVSTVDDTLGLSVEKHYALGEAPNTLVVNYRIRNAGDESVTVAPWEITRLPAEGRVFFPEGDTGLRFADFAPLRLASRNGIRWFDYSAASIGPDNHKAMTDGAEGWLAYTADDYLVVKVFEDVPAELMAPGEGEIELYANGEGTYIELEQQGYLTTLMPGEHLSWTVTWVLSRVSRESAPYKLVEKARTLSQSVGD